MTTIGAILSELRGGIPLTCMDISSKVGKSLQYTYYLLRELIQSGDVIILTRDVRPETGHVANFYIANPTHENK